MRSMQKRERLRTVLEGRPADRPPVSAWRHFTDFEHLGPRVLAERLIEFQKTYDWDFMKINPRAVYYHEAWGNTYDYTDYRDVVPLRTHQAVRVPEDLRSIVTLPGGEGVFAEQIEMVRILVGTLGAEVPLFQTLFTPIGILLNLCGMRSLGRHRESPRENSPLIQMIHANRQEVHDALSAISATLADYARKLTGTGVDGVFYAALGMARSGYFTPGEWDEFVKPYDLIVLDALNPVIKILHTCGIYSNPERFADYPIDVLHWAPSAEGNCKLLDCAPWIGGIVPMGGVDERLFGDDRAAEIAASARSAIRAMRGRPFILAPDCSVSIHTSDSELRAFRGAPESSDFTGEI